MSETKDTFHLWAFSCTHVSTDLSKGRESLADALRQSEQGGDEGGPPFDWHIAVDTGDMAGADRVLPDDEEGEEIVRQFSMLKKHKREDIYSVCGNHDRSGLGEAPNVWWRRWLDPTGENTRYSGIDPGNRPYPVDGTWERYFFKVGNILFLMISQGDFKARLVRIIGNFSPICLFPASNDVKGITEFYPDLLVLRGMVYGILANKL